MIGQMQCVCEIHLYKSRIVDIEAVMQRYCMSERLRNTFGIVACVARLQRYSWHRGWLKDVRNLVQENVEYGLAASVKFQLTLVLLY